MPNMKLFQKSAPIESLVVPKRVYSFLEDEAKDDPSDNYNGSLGDTSWKIVEDECGQIPIDKDQIPKLLRFKDTFTVFSGTVQRYFSNLYGHGDHHVKKLLRKLDEIDERIKLLIEACANKIVGPQYDISFERYDRECLEFGAKLEKFMSKHDEQRLQQLSAAECEQWRREGSFLVEEYNNELLKWTLSLSTMVVDARNTQVSTILLGYLQC